MLKLWLLTLALCVGALAVGPRDQRVRVLDKEVDERDQVTAQEHDRKIAKVTNERNKLKEHVDKQKFQKHGVKVENFHRDTLKDDRKNEVLFEKDHDRKVEVKRDRKFRKTKVDIENSRSGSCSRSGSRSCSRSRSGSRSCSGSNESCGRRKHQGCGWGWPWAFGGGCGCRGSKWCDSCIKNLAKKNWNLFHKMCKCGWYLEKNAKNHQCICSKC